jgi:hypothetical protein
MEYAGVIWRTTDDRGGRWVTSRTGEVLLDLHPFDSCRLIAVGGGYDDGVGSRTTTAGCGGSSPTWVLRPGDGSRLQDESGG